MKNLITLLFSVTIFSLPFSVQAQSIFSSNLQYNHQGLDLHEQGFQHGGGISSMFLFPSISKSPTNLEIRPGFRLDLVWNGSAETPKVAVDADDGTPYDIGVRNSNTGLYSTMRISQKIGRSFSLYADGLLGARMFWSREYIDGYVSEDACPKLGLPSLTNEINLSYGASMGMTLDLFDDVSLDVRGTYLRSGQASFVNLGSIAPGKDAQPYSYSIGTARANQFMLEVGVQFMLFCY